jgi:hypothetical protein
LGLISTLAILIVGTAYGTTQIIGSNPRFSRSASELTVPVTSSRSSRDFRPATTPTSKRRSPRRSGAGLFNASDRLSFQRLERDLGGTSGIAASAVGLDRHVSELGTLHEGVAWSTIKVPIALAVEARWGGQPSASVQALLARAISASDNSAAEALWAGLGSPADAAAAVENVLAAGGDSSTNVETRVLRPGFTSFGQTQWPLAVQERFMAALPCLANSGSVLSLMQQVVPDQRWGLGTLGFTTEFKGGWGPDPEGPYLARQMGIIELSPGRSLAVSIATIPADGTFATATANLRQIAEWLVAHVDSSSLSPVRCSANP